MEVERERERREREWRGRREIETSRGIQKRSLIQK